MRLSHFWQLEGPFLLKIWLIESYNSYELLPPHLNPRWVVLWLVNCSGKMTRNLYISFFMRSLTFVYYKLIKIGLSLLFLLLKYKLKL